MTTRKSGVIVGLAASHMTSSTQFLGVKSEFPGGFYAQNALNGRTGHYQIRILKNCQNKNIFLPTDPNFFTDVTGNIHIIFLGLITMIWHEMYSLKLNVRLCQQVSIDTCYRYTYRIDCSSSVDAEFQ